MKSSFLPAYCRAGGRTPQGVRGLKYPSTGDCMETVVSHPARGAWIEIVQQRALADLLNRVAPRKGCVD